MEKKFKTAIALILSSIALGGCSCAETVADKQAEVVSEEKAKQESIRHKQQQEINNIQKEQDAMREKLDSKLGKINFKPNTSPIVFINKDNASIDIKNWDSNGIVYQALDDQKRTSRITTAFLEKRNLSDKKFLQTT